MTDSLARLQSALSSRYAIEREIGAGGMATVYLAEDLKHHRKVAVKVLRAELAAALGADRFLREIEIEARLQHPNILTLIDSGEVAGLLYYVMPYVDGESLRDRIVREKQLAIPDVIRLLRDVADALAHAHQQGVVHRDIKPDNVLVSGGHRAIVMDFGVAKAVSEVTSGHEVTTAGIALGTPTYMSPEQAVADPTIDHRADIYGMGVLAYELLAGRPPFTGSSSQAILSAHLTEQPDPLDACRQGIPDALTHVVMRCLEKDPDKRWQDAGTILERLEAITTPSGGTASTAVPGVGEGYGPQATYRLGRRAGRVAVMVGVVLLCLVTVKWWLDRRAAIRDLITSLSPAIEEGRYGEVYDRLQEAGRTLTDSRLAEVAATVGGYLNINTLPDEATVRLVRVQAVDSFTANAPLTVGSTPISGHPLVADEYLITLSRDTMPGLQLLVNIDVGEETAIDINLGLTGGTEDGMVWVDSGAVIIGAETSSVPGFLIDQHEVTNEQYLEFVTAGGYTDATLWLDTLAVDGAPMHWAAATLLFVDRTGLTGPRSWSGGGYADGHGDHPVTGVSWYEASAYSRWIGKQLPSLDQWYRAALGEGDRYFPWGDDVMTTDWRANFSLVGAEPVGSYPLGVSPVGCFDMAGNVREWIGDSIQSGGRRFVVGGSWQDPTYMFEPAHVEPFDPWYAGNELGFRLAMPLPNR